jgi:hypothetical protein
MPATRQIPTINFFPKYLIIHPCVRLLLFKLISHLPRFHGISAGDQFSISSTDRLKLIYKQLLHFRQLRGILRTIPKLNSAARLIPSHPNLIIVPVFSDS